MIPAAFITEWRAHAPWSSLEKTEQDLMISRALVEIFSDPALAGQMAFRGGTALHKIHLPPAARYSEDIDLVQSRPGPIGPVFDALRVRLEPWLGKPKRDQGPGVVTLTYKVQSQGMPPLPLRLKVEINSREHFDVLGIEKRVFSVESRWFTGHCDIPTYRLEELLGTKLRALYQRRKGRDLFDIWHGLTQGHADAAGIADCFRKYMEHGGHRVTAPMFRPNLEAKLSDAGFLSDTGDLLRAGIHYNAAEAYTLVDRELLSLLA